MNIFKRIKLNTLVAQRKRRMKRLGGAFPLERRLHGVKKSQGALAQSRTGDGLQIVHVPVEGYPKNVFAYSIPLNRILGYLDETACEKLLFALGDGFCVDGEIKAIYQEEEKTGCVVSVFPTSARMIDVEDFSHLYGE